MTRRAHTLLESTAVILMLGVLAAIVVPRFAGATDEADTSATRSVLGGVRSGVSAFRARSIIEGTGPFPTLTELNTPGDVLDDAIPPNPFTGVSGVRAVSQGQADARTVVSPATAGWCYFVDNASDPPVAIFYANSSEASTVPDGSGGTLLASEL